METTVALTKHMLLETLHRISTNHSPAGLSLFIVNDTYNQITWTTNVYHKIKQIITRAIGEGVTIMKTLTIIAF